MIFVTVGTHEQPFDRLIRTVDRLKKEGVITEDVVIQTGYSDYEPKNCVWSKFYSYEEMMDYIGKASIVISHGGPSSFIIPLQVGKIPIVVPRIKEFCEHVNNHQVDFCKAVAERYGFIITLENINDLGDTIKNYPSLTKDMVDGYESNNERFCEEIDKIIENMVK